MTPEQALNVLSQATEANIRLTRGDYVLINQALGVLAEFIKQNTPDTLPAPKEERKVEEKSK